MPGKFEKRSARLLALFLAFIMVGSAVLIAFRGMGSTQLEIRHVKYKFKTFDDWLKCVPPSQSIIYVSTVNCTNDTLWNYVQRVMNANMVSAIFQPVEFTNPIQRMLVAEYQNGLLYLIDINMSSMKVKGEKINVNGVNVWVDNVKVGNSYYEVAATPEVSPAIVGTATQVKESVEALTSNKTNMYDLVGNYTERIPGNFNAIFMFYGKKAESIMTSNGTPFGNFYFAGIRMNGSLFEKVVAIHFTVPGIFMKNNTTNFAYYQVKNYKDGLSVAIMDSKNLTALLSAEPKMKVIFIKLGK